MAQALFNFRQGESKRVIVELRDPLDATYDVSDAMTIRADVYIQGKATRLKYALSPTGDEKALFINQTDGFKIDIPVDRDESKLLDTGALMVDVVVTVEDTDMPDGDAAVEFAPIKVGSLSKGYMKDAENV